MRDYNFQRHMAHEERQDGCHSPAEVLGWIKGAQPEPALVHQAFSAVCETRRLNKAGYAKFRNWSLYGERGLAGEVALVNIFQDVLTLDYEQEKLSRYSVEWQPDERHLARVGNPRFSSRTPISLLEPRTLGGWLGRVVRDHSPCTACARQETQKSPGGDATSIAS